jgi:monothiol glutaredoxin
MNSTQANAASTDVAADGQPNVLREQISEAIAANEVILFMKGTPEAPACGFSARTVASLEAVGTPFASVDVLADPRIRQELTALSSWPTIPQLFVGGELVGGCDIVTEMLDSGELAELLGEQDAEVSTDAQASHDSAAQASGFTPVENHLS